ncbi:MAG TPA: TPM domain-containing protein [Nitrospira sp.]|nr:TPM domain-containing protein [Nitrospira sp.]
MSTTRTSRLWRGPAWLVLFVGMALIATPIWALDVPPLTGRIVDVAHVLPTDLAATLTRDLQDHETKTGNQVAVLILPSLEGEPLEEFSHRVATTWKLGQKGTDNGVLLLIALRDRKVRIEVGYGLEGTLTDLRSAHIIRNDIVPPFRTGDLPGGIAAGVHAILHSIEGTYTPSEHPRRELSTDETIIKVAIALVVGIFFGMVLTGIHPAVGGMAGGALTFWFSPWLIPALMAGAATLLVVTALAPMLGGTIQRTARRGRHDGFWYSSGSGGWGGGSFGSDSGFSGFGGDFGGGGASGGW